MTARLPILLCGLLATVSIEAAEVKIFRTDSREGFAQGTLDGISVSPEGALELARRVERLAILDEPFVFSAAAHPDGWVVGTGNAGKVLLADAQGGVRELWAAPEPEIFALWADPDGAVLIGSSPDGKVYRLAPGADEAEELFDPEETYVWGLARDRDGRLLVATGVAGRLYRVAGDGSAEVLYESADTHVRSLVPLADGAVLVGTAGQGLIVRVGAGGGARTLHDAVHPEILAFTPAGDGVVYAAALASEASQVSLSGTQAQAAAAGGDSDGDGDGDGEASVSVVVQGSATVGSRAAGFQGARSAILKIAADGTVEEVADFQDETVHSILWHAGELWIGTGQEGRLYRWVDDGLVRERELEERQITGLVAGPAGAAAVTANASALYAVHGERVGEGTYTSAVADAVQVARFGSFRWRGELPRGVGVTLAFRSGMSAAPDDTWTPWSAVAEARCTDCGAGGGRGQETPLAGLAHGRYVQWRAAVRAAKDRGARLESTELTYRQNNLRPEVEKLEVLDPGEILVPSNFNPQSQTFEPWSPNREGIFTSLRPEKANGDSRLKTLWKKGYRTVRWTAKDPNEDELVYGLHFRLDGAAAQDAWLPVVAELEETHYSFDATVLPDGTYRFRLTADDRSAHTAAQALQVSELSERVVIDHTPPVLVSSRRRGDSLEVVVEDARSPLRAAVVSTDAGQWQPAEATDGLLDGRREAIRVTAPESAHILLLRITDAAFNVVTLNLLENPS